MERPDDMHQEPSTAPDPEVDAIYEAMTPRLRAARRAYVRTRFGAALALPLALGAGLAYAVGPSDTATAQLAAGRTVEIPADLEEHDPKAAPEATAKPTSEPSDVPQKEHTGEGAHDDEAPIEAPEWQWVELGSVGRIQVALTDNGIVVGETVLEDGWSVEVLAANETVAALVLTNEEGSLLAKVGLDEEGHVHAELDEIESEPEPEPTPTPKPEHDDEETEPTPKPTPKESTEPTPEPTPKEEPKDEREVQTRKEIDVSDVGRVVIEREGEKLWLGVTWNHQWWDPVVVVEYGAEVHAYFTNDGFEYHVRAWAGPYRIKHETWVVEPRAAAYDGWVSCGFGAVGVLVEGNVARVMTVEEHEGSDWVIVTEVGEVVKVKFITGEGTWILEAWGDGEQVVASCREK